MTLRLVGPLTDRAAHMVATATAMDFGSLVVIYAGGPMQYDVSRRDRDQVLPLIEYPCCSVCGARNVDPRLSCPYLPQPLWSLTHKTYVERPCSKGPECDWTDCDSDWHETRKEA